VTIDVRPAGQLADGQTVSVIEISNPLLRARFLNLGATLWQLRPEAHPTGDGVCLFHHDPLAYADNPPYLGCAVGPLANRVANSTFVLDGHTHDLTPNEGPHQLHSGPTGFSHRLWEFETDAAADSVTFRFHRPDGEGGYPGNLDLSVTWTLERNSLLFEWVASTDHATPVSITNHTYWNLAGGGTIEQHRLRLDATELVAVDDELIPTGELTATAGTPFDLRHNPRLGAIIGQLALAGIDHCYTLDPGARTLLTNPDNGLRLEVETSLPGVQIYTGHHLDGSAEHGGYASYSGVALETQFYPDAVNQPQFPSPVLTAHETVRHWTRYTLHQ